MIWILSSPGHKNVSQTMIHRLYYVVTVVRVNYNWIFIFQNYNNIDIIWIRSPGAVRVRVVWLWQIILYLQPVFNIFAGWPDSPVSSYCWCDQPSSATLDCGQWQQQQSIFYNFTTLISLPTTRFWLENDGKSPTNRACDPQSSGVPALESTKQSLYSA